MDGIKRVRLFLKLPCMLALNYLPLILDCLCYEAGGPFTLYTFPLLLAFIVYCNFSVSEKFLMLLFMDLNMILAVFLGETLSSYLYIKNVSDDGMTIGISKVMIFFSVAYAAFVSMISLLVYAIRFWLKTNDQHETDNIGE